MRRCPFFDAIGNRPCVLIASTDWSATGVEHGGCDQLADVSPELDAFYCPKCRWSGRVSGAWVVDMVRAEHDDSDRREWEADQMKAMPKRVQRDSM